MSLLLRHPKIANRSCEDCKLHVYDEKTGERSLFRGEPVKRAKGAGPPCTRGDGKCPKGHYDNPLELSSKNRAAYLHYLECRAVGSFPDDAIVRRNASLIRSVEDGVEIGRQMDFQLAILRGSRGV